MRKTFVALFAILLLAVAGVISLVHKGPDSPPRLKMVLFCYTTNSLPPPPPTLRHLYPLPSGTALKVGRIEVLNQGARSVSIRGAYVNCRINGRYSNPAWQRVLSGTFGTIDPGHKGYFVIAFPETGRSHVSSQDPMVREHVDLCGICLASKGENYAARWLRAQTWSRYLPQFLLGKQPMAYASSGYVLAGPWVQQP